MGASSALPASDADVGGSEPNLPRAPDGIFFTGMPFHRNRFWMALVTGLLTLLVVEFTGLMLPLERALLDIRLRVRPNLVQQAVPVRVALLEARDLMDDHTFQRRSVELLQALQDPALPALLRPTAVAFATPFLRTWPELKVAQEPDEADASAEAPPAASDGGIADSPTPLIPSIEASLTHTTELGGIESATGVSPRVVHAFLFNPEGVALQGEPQIMSAGWPLPPNAGTLRRADAVLLPHSKGLASLTRLAYGIGYANVASDESRLEIIRTVPVITRFRGRVYPCLGLAAAMAHLDLGPDKVTIEVGKAVTLHPPGQSPIQIPIDEHGDTLLNFRSTLGRTKPLEETPLMFRGPVDFAQPFQRVVSALPPHQMLTQLQPGGKLLLVGDPRAVVRSPLGSNIPLVNVHAQLVVDILTRDFLRPLPYALDLLFAVLALAGLALYLGVRDPQGLGGVWMGLLIGGSHGALAILLFALGPWWMNLATTAFSLFVTVLFDGFFLHHYLQSALDRVRNELDLQEQQASTWFASLTREEQEQAVRLEQLQREEQLARTILRRQESLVAKALPSGEWPQVPDINSGTISLTDAPLKPDDSRWTSHGERVEPPSTLPLNARMAPQAQPLIIHEVSRRYRGQVRRLEALLTRYRHLLDQVLSELEHARGREPALWNADVEEALADELVTRTGVLTRDPAMLRLLHQIVTRVGPNDRATVLIKGESGTGKELIAQAIHRTSPRRQGPFVPINCAAIPEGLIESELFGHVKGAFSGAARDRRGAFQSAQGGVLFLDEIGDAPSHIQVKLLRALQERQIRPVGADADVSVDVRIVAATHRDLKSLVRKGTFREDLYHRLHVIPLELASLRARKGDIPLLSRFFLEREAKASHQPLRPLSEGALARLQSWPWPGNVRELENCIVALHATTSESPISDDAVSRVLGGASSPLHSASVTSPPRNRGWNDQDLRWLELLRRHRFSIVHAVAEPEAPAHNRQTGYRRLVGLSCKALYLSDWRTDIAAALLAGTRQEPPHPGDIGESDPDPALTEKALHKLQTYLKMLRQAVDGKNLQRFQADWRRFLGEDFFYVNATLEALRAGQVQAGEGPGEEEEV